MFTWMHFIEKFDGNIDGPVLQKTGACIYMAVELYQEYILYSTFLCKDFDLANRHLSNSKFRKNFLISY